MWKVSVRLTALAVTPLLCFAASTRTWLSSSYADFEKGDLKGVSVRSDGRITLAPRSRELFDSSLAYLWALARDSKGVVYAGGGPGAAVYRFANGKSEKIAQFDAVEVHALAIDRHDRVYAATFPDGRIYRLGPGGKTEEFFNPKQKYIWSMLFDRNDNLFVATGGNGEIYRVTPDGKGSVFFRSDDTHVRSLAFAGADLIAGTDPAGLVIRVNPKGEGFVVYQLPRREVTAVAAGPDGSIFASGAGTPQTAGSPGPLASTAAASAPTPALARPMGNAPAAERPASEAPRPEPRPIPLTGGSEVYRIDPSGLPQRIWSHPTDVVYTIAFDREGVAILGSGNKGTIYRVDSPSLYTALEIVNVNQITALLAAGDGSLIAATGNLGKVFQFGPDLETEGAVTSEVFDSGGFSTWGRITHYGNIPDGTLNMESHSGNLDRPRYFWSDWSATAPPASRFIQWRARLTTAHGASPVLDSVELAYLPRNVAPRVEDIESTPPNYKFPAPAAAVAPARAPATLNLPAMGRRLNPGSPGADNEPTTMAFAKGWIGVRWTASDENADPLRYNLEIRGVGETGWKPLKDGLAERHYSFDSTAFPDGEYRVRVVASDQPGNPGGEGLTGQLDSSPILIDNTPPVISGLRATRAGAALQVTWKASDALSVIRRAEYAIDGEEWILAAPVSRISDAQSLEYALTLPAAAAGEHTIAVRVADDYENACVEKVVVAR